MYLGRDWSVDHNQTVKVNNAELRYTTLGKDGGEPVLCIHGTNIADFLIAPLQFYPPLFEKYQFISYYRAGYSGSTLPWYANDESSGCWPSSPSLYGKISYGLMANLVVWGDHAPITP